jgi:putative hemolysin
VSDHTTIGNAPEILAADKQFDTSNAGSRARQFFRPVIWFMSVSTNALLRLLRVDPHAEADEISEEELRDLVGSHEQLTVEERRVLTDVFRAADRVLREVMVPRTEVWAAPRFSDSY